MWSWPSKTMSTPFCSKSGPQVFRTVLQIEAIPLAHE
jgi:hypothetical protein